MQSIMSYLIPPISTLATLYHQKGNTICNAPASSPSSSVYSLRIGAVLLAKLPTDEHPTDLASARANLIELGIPQETARIVIIDVPISTEALDSIQGHLGGPLRRVEDGPGAILVTDLPGITGPSHSVG